MIYVYITLQAYYVLMILLMAANLMEWNYQQNALMTACDNVMQIPKMFLKLLKAIILYQGGKKFNILS